jgi:hypothetical protein
MINKSRIGTDTEGTGPGVITGNIPAFVCRE